MTATLPARARSSSWLVIATALVTSCTPLRDGAVVVRDDASAAERDGGERDAAHDAGGGCPVDPPTRAVAADTVISELTEWTCEAHWVLEGDVVVEAGALLRIGAGTRISVADRAVLLVARGGRIEAIGRRDAPIVMTPLSRPADRAQWRGLALLGEAPTGFTTTTRVPDTLADGRAAFGGTDPDADCGRLEYLRIEHAGGSSTALNDYFVPAAGLTLAGCGRRTVVDHVQVHRAADGIGLVGGSAVIRHALVTDPDEDGIEWAAGYRGLVQFAVVQTFPGSGSALKGSREEGEFEGEPESEPAIFNVTLAGAAGSGGNGLETGVTFQVGTLGWMRNSLVHGFPGAWANITDAETGARLASGRLGISHTLFVDRPGTSRPGFPGGVPAEDEDGDLDEDAHFRASAWASYFPTTPVLRAPYARGPEQPDFTGGDLAAGVFAPGPEGWSDVYRAAAYYGAIEPLASDSPEERARVDWTLGWTSFAVE